MANHGNGISNLENRVGNIENEISEMNAEIKNFAELAEQDHEILINIAASSKEETVYNIEVLSNNFARSEVINEETFLSALELDDSHAFARDWNGSTVYGVDVFYNTPIITSYEDNGNEVYFYGRYNESGNWNGTCILNTYNGDNLVSIFEGVYQNGNLFSYKRVDDEKDGTWLVTDRISQDNYNMGKTWRYSKSNEFVKTFDAETIKEKQIITVDEFLNSTNERLMSYYKGNTSNGLYNDSTGKAYLIKYKDDGNLDYLYVGKMKDGYPNDNTGKAWSVAWGHANDGYHYYDGNFYGKDQKVNYSFKPMSKDEIEGIINPKDFDYPLTGLIDSGL
ncbi:MAG: hypothetical protein K1W16_08080 [Lachnospiraceae bacterium]